MSVLTPAPTRQRHQRAAQDRGALGRGAGSEPGQLRLRVIRRAEPDVAKLVQWVLNMTPTSTVSLTRMGFRFLRI